MGADTILEPIPWAVLAEPLVAAEDALARLDERLRSSPIGEGWISRTHFQDACASLWLEGELVTMEDLVLHDAGMDIRAPTHELTRAHAVLRLRRKIAAEAPGWATSATGLAALCGPDERVHEGTGGDLEERAPENAPAVAEETIASGFDPLAAEFAAIDLALERAQKTLTGNAPARQDRDPLLYDADWNEEERLAGWQALPGATRSYPPLLAAAILWDAWEANPPLQHRAWLGRLLIAAELRARGKTRAHLFCLNAALRHVRVEKRRSRDRVTRLLTFLAAIVAGAEAGGKDHDRWLLAKAQLERKLVGRRSTSSLPRLVGLALAKPVMSSEMIARELGVTPRAAQDMAGALGLREMTGRGRYRAWGIL